MNNLRIDEVIREMDTERDYVVSLRRFFMKTRNFQGKNSLQPIELKKN